MPRIELGNVTIDRDRFEVRVGERRVDLTFVEFELLYQLARNAGKVLTRSRLVSAVWHEPASGENRKLTVHMSRLRTKMRGSSPWQIETVTKRGYALVPEDGGFAGGPGGEHATPEGTSRRRRAGRPSMLGRTA
jgi:DNA-binding response OmpR family regulator